MIFPPATVMVNDDLIPEIQQWLERQLFISQTLDGYHFDQQVNLNPNFVKQLKINNQRLLVIRDLRETQNRDLMDLVLFIKEGVATSLKNNFGPPILSHEVLTLSWKNFGFS